MSIIKRKFSWTDIVYTYKKQNEQKIKMNHLYMKFIFLILFPSLLFAQKKSMIKVEKYWMRNLQY
jgi:hypothetical protein